MHLDSIPTAARMVSRHPIKCQKDIESREGDPRISHADNGRLLFMADPIFLPLAVFELQRDVVARMFPAATAVFADNNGGSGLGWGIGILSGLTDEVGQHGDAEDRHQGGDDAHTPGE